MTSPSLHLGYAGTVTSKYCGEVTHDRKARLIRQMRGKKIDRLRQRIGVNAVPQSGACHACGLDALFSQQFGSRLHHLERHHLIFGTVDEHHRGRSFVRRRLIDPSAPEKLTTARGLADIWSPQ